MYLCCSPACSPEAGSSGRPVPWRVHSPPPLSHPCSQSLSPLPPPFHTAANPHRMLSHNCSLAAQTDPTLPPAHCTLHTAHCRTPDPPQAASRAALRCAPLAAPALGGNYTASLAGRGAELGGLGGLGGVGAGRTRGIGDRRTRGLGAGRSRSWED